MARFLVEKLEFDAPEVLQSSKPGSRDERPADYAELRAPNRTVYVAAGQLSVVQQILKEACNEVGEVFEECAFETTRLKLYRLPGDWIELNGDALSGFSESSAAPGLVLRSLPTAQAKAFLRLGTQVQTAQSVDIRLLRRRGCCLLPHERAEVRRLAGRERNEKVAPLVRITVPSQAALAAFSDLITLYNHEDRTIEKAALLPSGVRIPCPNPDCQCPITGFCEETVVSVAAACSIQAAWRSVRGRARLPVSLHRQVLARRAAVCVQRYWRAFLLRSRCALLRDLREVAAQAAHDTLAMSLAEQTRMIRHLEMRIRPVLPEQKLRFIFASGARVHLHHFNLPFRKAPFPRWLGVHFPTLEIDSTITETRTIEALLTEGVKQEGLASVLGQSKVSAGTGVPVQTSGSPQGSKVSGRPRFSARPEEWGFRPTTGTKASFPAERRDVVHEGDDVIPRSHVAYENGQLYDDVLPLRESTSALIGNIRRPMTGATVVGTPSKRTATGAGSPIAEERGNLIEGVRRPMTGATVVGTLPGEKTTGTGSPILKERKTLGESRSGRSAGASPLDVEKGKRIVKLLRFDSKEEAQRRAVLLYALTYDLRERCGVRLVSAAPPNKQSAPSHTAVPAYTAHSPIPTAATSSAGSKDYLDGFPSGTPDATESDKAECSGTEHRTVEEVADTLLSMSVDTLRAREWAAVYGLVRKDLWVQGKGLHWLDLAMGRIEELLQEPGRSGKPDPDTRRLRLFGQQTLTDAPEITRDTIADGNAQRADALRTLKTRWERERLWRAEVRAVTSAALRASAHALTGLLRTTRTGLFARPIVSAETEAQLLARAARGWAQEEERKKKVVEEGRLEATRLRGEMRERVARHAQAVAKVSAKERVHLRAEAATCRQISEAEERAARKRRAARAQLAQRKASDRDFAIALGGEFRKMGNHLAAADLRAARERSELVNRARAAFVRSQENLPVRPRETLKYTKCEG